MMPDARHPWSEKEKNILNQELGKIFKLIEWFYSNNLQPIQFSSINDAYENMLKHDLQVYNNFTPQLNINRSIIRCGMGTTFGSIGYDGSIFGCQEQTSKTKDNIFYLGNIFDTKIEKNKHIALLKEYNKKYISQCENQQICNDCSLRNICYGFNCPSSSYDLSNSFSIGKEINCLWHQWIFNNAILLNNKMVKENNQLFKKYLETTCHFNSKLKKED
jgi:radical SAM protein with 4Fe4S-binding SPASM domain